jgi:DNA integrity scanning protein DisA with diadenylate cyclase activity
MVGGADADLIIDDMLVDIKTTKSLELSKDYFHQLIGYLTLYYLNGVIERKKSLPEINKLAIYFSRFSYLYVIQVESVASYEKFAQFSKWFFERAKADSDNRKSQLPVSKASL